MYTNGACMVWNGHALTSQEHIHAFLTGLPQTEHNIQCVDAQAIPGKFLIDFMFMIGVGRHYYSERIGHHDWQEGFILGTAGQFLTAGFDCMWSPRIGEQTILSTTPQFGIM